MTDKLYVNVLAICHQNDTTKPLGVIWPDGRKFGIDNVLAGAQACGTSVKSAARRYTFTMKRVDGLWKSDTRSHGFEDG